jgi:type VI secretion system protein ImpB
MIERNLPFEIDLILNLSGNRLSGSTRSSLVEIDPATIDKTLEAIAPHVAFSVPNVLTGNGEIAVDLSFHRMEDFSPEEIAKQIDPLAKLIEVRNELDDLIIFMGGRERSQDVIDKVLEDPDFLASLARESSDTAASEPTIYSSKAKK